MSNALEEGRARSRSAERRSAWTATHGLTPAPAVPAAVPTAADRGIPD